jgi:hypothetical protein
VNSESGSAKGLYKTKAGGSGMKVQNRIAAAGAALALSGWAVAQVPAPKEV